MTRVGTKLTGEGTVIFKDVTVHGLHRMCIEQMEKYPDIEAWAQVLGEWSLARHDYRERLVSGVMVCHLWIYWKE